MTIIPSLRANSVGRLRTKPLQVQTRASAKKTSLSLECLQDGRRPNLSLLFSRGLAIRAAELMLAHRPLTCTPDCDGKEATHGDGHQGDPCLSELHHELAWRSAALFARSPPPPLDLRLFFFQLHAKGTADV